MMTEVRSGVLAFDGECRYCTRAAAQLRSLNARHGGGLRTIPLQRPGAAEQMGRPLDELRHEVHFRGDDGTVSTGAAATAAALSAAWNSSVPLAAYRTTAPLMEGVYRFVARHRGRLPGAVAHCEAHPEDCGRSPGASAPGTPDGGPARER